MGLKRFFENVFQSLTTSKRSSIDAPIAIETGTQRTKLPGYSFLYENPDSFLNLYKQLYDNVPVLEAAIDTYITLVNPSWSIVHKDPEVAQMLTKELKAAKFNDSLTQFIESYFLYGFSAQEMVLNDSFDRVIRYVTIPSKDMRIHRDPNAIIDRYFQTGLTSRYTDGANNRAASPGIENAYRRDELVNGKSGTPQIELNPNTITFASRTATLDNPYGRSLFLSMPWLVKIMVEMQDAYGKIYQKYGSPRFHVKYIPAVQLNQDTLNKRLDTIKSKFETLEQDADFFTAADVEINIMGAGDSRVIHFGTEMSEIMQGVFAGLKLPAGVLGYNYGSTETHLSKQMDILSAKIKSYQVNFEQIINERQMPLIANVYGLSEMPELKFGTPAIVDELAEAQKESARINNVGQKISLGLIDAQDGQEELDLEIKVIEPPVEEEEEEEDEDGNPIKKKDKKDKKKKEEK